MAIARSKLGSSLRTSRRCQIDGDPLSVRPAQPAVANGGGDPILALFDRGVRETDDRNLVGVSPSGVDFDLDLKGLDSDDRRRINLGWHKRTRYYFIIITCARNVLLKKKRVPQPRQGSEKLGLILQ